MNAAGDWIRERDIYDVIVEGGKGRQKGAGAVCGSDLLISCRESD